MKRIGLSWFVAIALFCLSNNAGQASDLDWKPATTWVFCVGLLEWQHTNLWSSFPECQKDRRDEQLVNYFRECGVPDDQITYLQDSEATKARIQKEFVELLENTDKGDLLVFYFCGH